MIKLLKVLPLALALGGCLTVQGVPNPITPKTVYEAQAAYDAAFLVPAAHYAALPRCTKAPAPCSDPALVKKLQDADKKVHAAVVALRAFVKANPTLDATSYISALEAAALAAETLITENGLH